jgi:hypothetical protein
MRMASGRPPLLGALAVVASLVITGCPPHVDGAARPAELARVRRIAVSPFVVPPGTPAALSGGMADELAARLAGTFRIVEGGASRDDVDAVLLGSVLEYRDRTRTPDADTALAVAVRLVDVRTREDILSASTEASAAASLCAQDMPCLRAKITEQIARWMIEQAAPRP